MRGWILPFLCLMPLSAMADTAADKDFLTTWLQDNLSGAGRTVTIDGFQGALSTKASLTQLTIADDKGVWLTLKDVTLDWSNSALLSGQIEVNELSAAEIDLDRMPAAQAAAPSPEARSLALPDLPVSIAIKGIAARKIVLGPSVLGQPLEASLTADLSLAAGEGSAHLDLQRSDGPQGHVTLSAGYSNTTQVLNLSLDAAEAAGGIAATLLKVPGAPATSLTIAGLGKLSDFTAKVNLSTDGTTRLAGKLIQTDDAQGTRSFSADLSGDPTPVFLPEYAAFFGPAVAIQAKGQRAADGALTLESLTVQARALSLQGSMTVAATGEPQALNFRGTLGLTDGPVTLPLPSVEPVRLQHADLSVSYDTARGPDWNFGATISQLDTGSLTAGLVRLRASGRLLKFLFDGTAHFAALSVQPRDPGLAMAMGPTLTGSANFSWNSATSALNLANLALTAPGYAITSEGSVGQMADLSGHVAGHYDDLSRLTILTGQPLSGGLRFDVTGHANPLSGAFDLDGNLLGAKLGVGIPQVDSLLAGNSSLSLLAKRDVAGITLRRFTVQAASLTADLTGTVASAGSDLSGSVNFADLAALGAGYRGSLAANGNFKGTLTAGEVTAQGKGQEIAIGQAQVDTLLRGTSDVSTKVELTPDGMRIIQADLKNPQLSASASGDVAGSTRNLKLSARLTNLALLYPQFPGLVTVSGTAMQGNDGTVLDLSAQGPGQINVKVKGHLASNFASANLGLSGTADAALADALIAPRSVEGPLRFDLQMNGPLVLSSLSGPISISGGRLSDPSLPFALKDLTGAATLGKGQVQVSGTSIVSSGGQIAVKGSVGLAAPYQANLAATLNHVVLRDPQLYATKVNGTVSFKGPALGGALVAGQMSLEKTELQIPSTGLGGNGDLPGLRHVNGASDVSATRARAGVGQVAARGVSGPAYTLDLTIRAPNQVFIRGRGLDAELGGSLTLRGSTANIVPSGGLNLIRGRLDILGRRLVLSEAQIQMEGALLPFVHVVASVESDGITSSVLIDGPVTSPVVTFTSVPDLPQEEVIARLLFNRGLDTMSAFQAVQLASAVATLAGRGGDGVIGALRKKTGLDNLDVQTDGNGNAAVTAGKYLGDKTYSEVTVDQTGKSSISLNYDLAPHITLKAHVDAGASTGVGIFLKRDY